MEEDTTSHDTPIVSTDKLTPNQLKKQKQKQKKALQKLQNQQVAEQDDKVEKKDNEYKEGVENAESLPANNEIKEDEELKQELDWCIHQLKLGLEKNNLSKEQIVESNKVINKLSSDKTPLVAKRHLMRVIFGDYRKLMKIKK